MAFGYPEVYGATGTGHCGHCGGLPEHALEDANGSFCAACFRWRTYVGPPQHFGDGMEVTQTPASVPRTFAPSRAIRKEFLS